MSISSNTPRGTEVQVISLHQSNLIDHILKLGWTSEYVTRRKIGQIASVHQYMEVQQVMLVSYGIILAAYGLDELEVLVGENEVLHKWLSRYV